MAQTLCQRITSILIFLAFCGCKGSDAVVSEPVKRPAAKNDPIPTGSKVRVQWNANLETAVNSRGGGYKVYYSHSPNSSIANASSVDVPYTSGVSAPTSALLQNLTQGIYYIKIIAYSAVHPVETSGNSTSLPTSEITITVP